MLKKSLFAAMLLIVMLLGVACGSQQEPEAAGGITEATPVTVVTEAPGNGAAKTPGAQTTRVPGARKTAAAATALPAVEPPTVEAPAGATVYTIDQAASQVRFELDEDLRGSRITVVGQTNQVVGQIGLNLADLSNSQMGVLQITAQALATDSRLRNRAIQSRILNTDDYPFITFTPTSIDGLPPSAAVGDTVQFTITGDLTIRDITQSVTFTVDATVASEGQIVGTASAVINRTDYELNIPSVPNVANVEEEVDLIIDFTANAN